MSAVRSRRDDSRCFFCDGLKPAESLRQCLRLCTSSEAGDCSLWGLIQTIVSEGLPSRSSRILLAPDHVTSLHPGCLHTPVTRRLLIPDPRPPRIHRLRIPDPRPHRRRDHSPTSHLSAPLVCCPFPVYLIRPNAPVLFLSSSACLSLYIGTR